MTTLCLTINLYPLDEVITSFKQCILQKKTLHETLFWLWELIYSGENVERLLEEIYLDFYASLNPSLYTYIKLKRKKYYKTYDKKELASIVCNLRLSLSSSDSYLLNYYTKQPELCFPLKIYKKPKWLENIKFDGLKQKKELIPLILSIHHYNIKNISYYLSLTIKNAKYDIETIYTEILNYFKFKNITEERIEHVEKIWKEKLILVDLSGTKFLDPCSSSGDKSLRLLKPQVCETPDFKLIIMIIVYLNIPETKLNKNVKYVAVDNRVLEQLEKHYTVNDNKIYYRLKEKRLYSTHHHVGPGDYGRFKLYSSYTGCNDQNQVQDPDILILLKDECCYRWEYYCQTTPYWKRIFDKYNIKFDEFKNILFESDDLLEEFYDNYGLDFDEQSIETQEKSIHNIHVENEPFIWFNKL